jgi:hypothetical protein
MADINHTWSGDIILSDYNDLDVVSDVDELNQRVLRRLLTNPKEYIWHPEYGAGLGRFIGVALDQEVFYNIQQLIVSQMYLESAVAKSPAPVVSLDYDNGKLNCSITYYSVSNTKLLLNFSLSS